jgi:hypothetical protein
MHENLYSQQVLQLMPLVIYTDIPQVKQDSTYVNLTLHKLFHKAHNTILLL